MKVKKTMAMIIMNKNNVTGKIDEASEEKDLQD
jgi:hypothetical protein